MSTKWQIIVLLGVDDMLKWCNRLIPVLKPNIKVCYAYIWQVKSSKTNMQGLTVDDIFPKLLRV